MTGKKKETRTVFFFSRDRLLCGNEKVDKTSGSGFSVLLLNLDFLLGSGDSMGSWSCGSMSWRFAKEGSETGEM
jgi:hypothetical protein